MFNENQSPSVGNIFSKTKRNQRSNWNYLSWYMFQPMKPLGLLFTWSIDYFELNSGVLVSCHYFTLILEHKIPDFRSNWSDDPGKENSTDFIGPKHVINKFIWKYTHLQVITFQGQEWFWRWQFCHIFYTICLQDIIYLSVNLASY